MGEKSPSEGGGNEAARSARLKKEREQAEAIRKAEAKKPMKTTGMSDRQMMAQESSYPTLTKGQKAAGQRTAGLARNVSAIEELQARRDDTRNPITQMNLDNQIAQLKQGAVPVQTTFRGGETLTVGVVSNGKYTGRPGYESAVKPAVSQGSSDAAPEPVVVSTPKPPVPTTAGDTGDAVRRAMLSTAGGRAIRRKYFGG